MEIVAMPEALAERVQDVLFPETDATFTFDDVTEYHPFPSVIERMVEPPTSSVVVQMFTRISLGGAVTEMVKLPCCPRLSL
jgi:hypothetical protein